MVDNHVQAIAGALRQILDEGETVASPGKIAVLTGLRAWDIGALISRQRELVEAACRDHGVLLGTYTRSGGRGSARIAFRATDPA
jgi:hypothetical protein